MESTTTGGFSAPPSRLPAARMHHLHDPRHGKITSYATDAIIAEEPSS